MRKLDEFFYDRYIDRVMEEVMRDYVENPAIMVDDKGEEYWVGYNK